MNKRARRAYWLGRRLLRLSVEVEDEAIKIVNKTPKYNILNKMQLFSIIRVNIGVIP